MSQGQSVTPSPPAINWAHIISVCVTVVGMLASQWLHSGGQSQPVPTPPSPPAPDPPISIVSIVDAKGNAVTDLIDAGNLFVVTGPDKSELTAVVAPGSDIDVVEVAPNKLNAVIRSGTLQIVVTGAGKPSIVSVKCGHGAQPPPDDKTIPAPVSKHVTLSIIDDTANMSPNTSLVLNQIQPWKTKSTLGFPAIVYNQSTTEPIGIKAVSAMKAKGVSVPALVIHDDTGNVVSVGALISYSDAQSQVNKITGGSQ